MAYNANIPQASQRLKDSQPQILANFQALEPFGNNFALLSVLGGDQTTSATQLALYAKNDAGVPQLFLRRESDGEVIDFSRRVVNATSGTTRLPSGILIKWGRANTTTISPGNSIVVVPFDSTIAFASIFSVVITNENSAATPNTYVTLKSYTTTNFTVEGSQRTTTTGISNYLVNYVAIGL